MAHHEVLLLKPVDGLGAEGDQVKVRAGYARNFLLPQKYAVALTQANRKRVDALKKRRTEREASELSGAQALADKISKVSLAFAVKTGEGGKMFGAITANDIHEKLVAGGVDIDKKKIHLHTPVKTLGKHEVKIKLHSDVSVEVSFDVVSENPIVEAAAEAPKASKEEYPEHAALEKQAARRAEKAKRSDRKK
ncbi:50S ribosomal protein L9 [Rariglobus hedericola]|uniref:Large ribosomal subunit protein bL9 n=1 Tax=Rariglobus hedericola TaxID=2597822 RepID=A0A556QLD7_9BACT|nr:50S ribosomal protein L9 [Rariglobus hedericola]TSJ77438.1 50S ribosomal protein L9 [Rariglobus hedericola]